MGKSWRFRTLISVLVVMFMVGSALMVSAEITVGDFVATEDGDWEGSITVDGVEENGDATIMVFVDDGEGTLDNTTIVSVNQLPADETGAATFYMIVPYGSYTIRAGGTGVETAMELQNQTIGGPEESVITGIEELEPIYVLDTWDLEDALALLPDTVKVYYGDADDFAEISVEWDTDGKSIPSANEKITLSGALDADELVEAKLVFEDDIELFAEIDIMAVARNVELSINNGAGEVIRTGETFSVKISGFGLADETRKVGYAMTDATDTPTEPDAGTQVDIPGEVEHVFEIPASYTNAQGTYKLTVFIEEDGVTTTTSSLVFVMDYLHQGSLRINPSGVNEDYTAVVLTKNRDFTVLSSFMDYNTASASEGDITYLIQEYDETSTSPFGFDLSLKLIELEPDAQGKVAKEQIAGLENGTYKMIALLNYNSEDDSYDAVYGRTFYILNSSFWGTFRINGETRPMRINKEKTVTVDADLNGYDKTVPDSGVLYAYKLFEYNDYNNVTPNEDLPYTVWPPAGSSEDMSFEDAEFVAGRLVMFAKFAGDTTYDFIFPRTVYLHNSFIEGYVNITVNGEFKGRETVAIMVPEDDTEFVVSLEKAHVPADAELTYLYELCEYKSDVVVDSSEAPVSDATYSFDLSEYDRTGTWYYPYTIKITAYINGVADVVATRTVYYCE